MIINSQYKLIVCLSNRSFDWWLNSDSLKINQQQTADRITVRWCCFGCWKNVNKSQSQFGFKFSTLNIDFIDPILIKICL